MAIGPLGLMAGGPDDHFTDSRELCWSKATNGRMWGPLIPTPVAGPAGLRNSSAGGRGARNRDRAVVPSAAELVEQLKGNRAAEGGGRAHRERVRGSQGETALGRSLGLKAAGPTPAMNKIHEPRTPHRSAPAIPRHSATVESPPTSASASGGTRRPRAGHCSFRLDGEASAQLAGALAKRKEQRASDCAA